MKKVIALLVVFLVFSCNVYKRDKFSYDYGRNTWINTYKAEVFYACIKEGFNNDSIIKLMSKKDYLNPYDEFYFSEIDSARILGKKIILNMPKVMQRHCDDCKGNEAIKNYVSINCLKYYASRELDSIAKAQYKKHIRN